MAESVHVSRVNSTTMITCYTLTNDDAAFFDTNYYNSQHFISNSLSLLELQIFLILFASHGFHLLLKRFGISLLVSSMITGILIGPTFLGKYEYIRENIFPEQSKNSLNLLSVISINIFMFLAAVKMDVGLLLTIGKKAMSIGISSTLIPFIVGLGYIWINEETFSTKKEMLVMLEVILMLSITTFPVVSYNIDLLDLTNSELGRLGLSSALVADIYSIVTLLVASLFRSQNQGSSVTDLFAVLGFIIVAGIIFRPIILWINKRTPQEAPTAVDSSKVGIIMALTFISGLYFFRFHHGPHLGAIILGFNVPAGSPLGSALVEKLESISLGYLLPLLIATSAARVNLTLIITSIMKLLPYLGVIGIIFSVKMAACCIPPLFCRMPIIDSIALAFLLNCKGIVELTTFVVFRDNKAVTEEVFSLIMLFILFSSSLSPILVKNLYDPSRKYAGYQSRNIMSLRPESVLRILTCIQRPNEIASVMKLIDTAYPTKESPIEVNVLHLIELIGQSTPVFITHEKGKLVSNPCSQSIITSFDQYQQHNWNSVSVNIFTAISKAKFMHEDVCTLALDKVASLIVVPFHRKRSNRSATESENLRLRSLARRVLDRAPCTVGILLDRSKYTNQSIESFRSLCMIFIGGDDDREALTLSKRMSKNYLASLTIIHLISENEESTNVIGWEEKILDSQLMEDIMQSTTDNVSILYKQHIVKDGPETALLVHTIANDYDLFIVGRQSGIQSRQTLGLSEWSELRELGVIGDFLASKDLNSEASVLVVQKQKQMKYLD